MIEITPTTFEVVTGSVPRVGTSPYLSTRDDSVSYVNQHPSDTYGEFRLLFRNVPAGSLQVVGRAFATDVTGDPSWARVMLRFTWIPWASLYEMDFKPTAESGVWQELTEPAGATDGGDLWLHCEFFTDFANVDCRLSYVALLVEEDEVEVPELPDMALDLQDRRSRIGR